MDLNTIIIAAAIFTLVILGLCILYLVGVYRKLLVDYNNLLLKENKSDLKKSIEMKADRFVGTKIDNAISEAISKANIEIEKSAKNITKSMRKKTVERLIDEKEAENEAIASSFDEAKVQIEEYKAREYEEIRVKANEILEKVTKEALGQAFPREVLEKLVMKAVEDAKRSNIL